MSNGRTLRFPARHAGPLGPIIVFAHVEICTIILARLIENYWMVPFALSLYLVQIIISR
jgi:hypothetical protein